jgi:hypothetical protein
MPFRCPQCLTPDTLEIIQSIDLPSDRRCDEISLQVIGCSACSFRGLAVYEELVHGAESETWHHIGYWVSRDAVESVLAAMKTCLNPYDPRCSCPAHVSLGEKDIYGIWHGLLEMERGHTFSMRIWNG